MTTVAAVVVSAAKIGLEKTASRNLIQSARGISMAACGAMPKRWMRLKTVACVCG